MRLRAAAFVILLALAPRATAVGELLLDCPERVDEGTAFVIAVAADTGTDSLRVDWLGETLRPALLPGPGGLEARTVLGMGMHERLDGDVHTLTVTAWRRGVAQRVTQGIAREPRDYPEQHLEVAQEFNEMSPEKLERIRKEQAATREALRRVTPSPRWPLPLSRPVAGRTTSDFGLRRFFNGEPKNPHTGVDFGAKAGTPVSVCEDGVVILTGEHYFAGNCVYVDHGDGLVSMYYHLSAIGVTVGQPLRRGEILGRVGATGRVTAAHLHWGVSAQGQLVDPLLLMDPAER